MAPPFWCWVLPFLLGPALKLSGGYPGRRVARICLSWLPVLAVHPSCCPSGSAVVSGHRHVSSIGSASAAIMPQVDSSGVCFRCAMGKEKNSNFINFERSNGLGFRAWSQLAVCMLSFCTKKTSDPEDRLFDRECQRDLEL